MKRNSSGAAIGIAIAALLSGCGESDSGGVTPPPPPPTQTSYVGATGPLSAWADTAGAGLAGPNVGTYNGKRQMQRGNVDPMTGVDLGQPAGVQVFKGDDGHVWAVDLTSTAAPAPVQLSTEAGATVDDLCSVNGTAGGGSTYDYTGVFFAADLAHPTDSTYVYRLPGADGACDTPDDAIHLVKTGMDVTMAPTAATVMPAATAYDASGAISGFIARSGTNLVMTDANLANPVTVGTFGAPIVVASPLPSGLVSGYATGRLFVVDGNIVFVDYAAHTTSAPLFTIPGWTPTDEHLVTAASPTTLYFAVNTAATPGVAASSTIYSMPADGSAPPTAMATQTGTVRQLDFPVDGSALVVGTVDVSYSIAAYPAAGGAASLLVSAPSFNDGRFTARADAVWYTTWQQTELGTVVTRTGTTSGITGMDGSTIYAPLANSMFLVGGEADAFAAGDTTTQRSAFVTMFQVQALAPVTVTGPAGSAIYTYDGIGGGTLYAFDAASHAMGPALGTFPASLATGLAAGTYRGIDHTLFLQAVTPISTQDPATQDLYLLNSGTAGSLVRATANL